MSVFPSSEDLTDDQSSSLERAAFMVIKARSEATAILLQSGLRPVPEHGWFGNPCGAMLPPPPVHHFCGCKNYTGDGGPCLTTYIDFTGPDFGSGPPRRTCGHRPSQHVET
jgi:hypothetical protein